MTTYDPKVIQKFAEKLYSQANSVVFTHGFLGAILGGVAGGVVGKFASFGLGFTLFLAVVACLMGVAVGVSKSFTLRLRAQEAHYDMQIEWNTRSLSPTAEKKMYSFKYTVNANEQQ